MRETKTEEIRETKTEEIRIRETKTEEIRMRETKTEEMEKEMTEILQVVDNSSHPENIQRLSLHVMTFFYRVLILEVIIKVIHS
jgi:hypothetical protein